MNFSYDLKTISAHAAEGRRRQLQSCFDYLLEKDNSPDDKNKEYFEFSLEERCLSEKGFEQVHSLDGHVEGSTVDGLVRYTRQQVVPDVDEPEQHWNIVYSAEGIVCEQWKGTDDGKRFHLRRERIARDTNLPSEVEEWQIAQPGVTQGESSAPTMLHWP